MINLVLTVLKNYIIIKIDKIQLCNILYHTIIYYVYLFWSNISHIKKNLQIKIILYLLNFAFILLFFMFHNLFNKFFKVFL